MELSLHEVRHQDRMKQLEAFGICEVSAKRCFCVSAIGVAGHAAQTGSNKVILKRETGFLKMTAAECRSSRSKRFAATHACSQRGIGVTLLQGNRKRELAPICEEVGSEQSRGCTGHRKGLAKRNNRKAAAQWDRKCQCQRCAWR